MLLSVGLGIGLSAAIGAIVLEVHRRHGVAVEQAEAAVVGVWGDVRWSHGPADGGETTGALSLPPDALAEHGAHEHAPPAGHGAAAEATRRADAHGRELVRVEGVVERAEQRQRVQPRRFELRAQVWAAAVGRSWGSPPHPVSMEQTVSRGFSEL